MRTALLILVLVLGVFFAVQNAAVVTLNVFFWRLDASLAVIIVLCFALGAAAAALAMAPNLYRSRTGARRLQARISELEARDAPEVHAVEPPPSQPIQQR